jgi:hypothetical protein
VWYLNGDLNTRLSVNQMVVRTMVFKSMLFRWLDPKDKNSRYKNVEH